MPHVAEALQELLGITNIEKKDVEDKLAEILEDTRGELEEIKIDNPDYDPEFAKIGREKESSDDDNDDNEENSEYTTDDDDDDNSNNKKKKSSKAGQQKLDW